MGAGEERETDPVDVTDDGEVEQVLPLEDIRESPGATASGMTVIGQEERHRFELPNGVRSKWSNTDCHFRVLRSPVVQ